MSDINDFRIETGVLRRYIGSAEDVVIPDTVTEIGGGAFEGCTGLISITIPDSVTKIGRRAFIGCTGLISITIPDSVTEIGGAAFYGCTGLISITIPDSVREIGGAAFYGCTGLTSITIPDSVTEIGGFAFTDCTGLRNITIPDSVTEIGDNAFRGCTGLTSITIHDSVTRIGDGAFWNCDNAIITLCGSAFPDYLTFPSTIPIFFPNAYLSDIPSKLKDSAIRGFMEKCDDTVNEDIKNGYLAYLKRQRKSYYSYFGSHLGWVRFFTENRLIPLAEVSLVFEKVNDDDVEAKALLLDYQNSFSDEEKVKLQKKQEKEQQNEFEKAVGLRKLTVADYKKMFGIRTNGDEVEISYWNGGRGIDSAVIPEYIGKKKVTKIGESAFKNRTGLTSIIIPDSVTEIGGLAFYGCTGLISITIPDSVTEIGESAFENCTRLTSIIIPGSVTLIDKSTFWHCDNLTSVTFVNGVTKIGWYAFENCTSLRSITIPDSVTEIGGGAFRGCIGPIDIYYTGTEEQWKRIVICGGNEVFKKATIHYNHIPC